MLRKLIHGYLGGPRARQEEVEQHSTELVTIGHIQKRLRQSTYMLSENSTNMKTRRPVGDHEDGDGESTHQIIQSVGSVDHLPWRLYDQWFLVTTYQS